MSERPARLARRMLLGLSMLFTRAAFALLAGLTFGVVSACGSKSFDDYESGGGAGKGGSASGSGGSAAATGGDAGSGASGSAGRGGASGSGTGGTGRGGTGTGGTGDAGTGAGGTDVGGASGAGAGGSGGMAAGAGGSLAGEGGTTAGAGGSAAGAGGCGICPFVACAPPVAVNVTAPGEITALEGQLVDRTTGTTLGPLQCFISITSPCTWSCQFYQVGLGTADYSIVLSAPGYLEKTIDFSVEAPQNCGCCGCRCGVGYAGEAELVPTTGETPACCSTLTDTTNCGSCGNQCDAGLTCTRGECTAPCLGEGSVCDGGGACCDGLTCCSGTASASRHCYAVCPP